MEILESGASSQIKITPELIDRTADLTGDRNLVHMKPTKLFKQKRIAHGITLTGFIMDLITKVKPDQLVQRLDLNMHNPAFLGDEVRTQIEVDQDVVRFQQFNQANILLIDGSGQVAAMSEFLKQPKIKNLDLTPIPYDMDSLEFPEVGLQASMSTEITRDLIKGMAELTDDQHPFEVEKGLGNLKAHDQILTGFASNMVANYLPGSGAIMKTVGFTVYRPAFAGETITVVAKVIDSNIKKKLLTIEVEMTNNKNELLLTGQATVLFLIMQGSARKALLDHLEELRINYGNSN